MYPTNIRDHGNNDGLFIILLGKTFSRYLVEEFTWFAIESHYSIYDFKSGSFFVTKCLGYSIIILEYPLNDGNIFIGSRMLSIL